MDPSIVEWLSPEKLLGYVALLGTGLVAAGIMIRRPGGSEGGRGVKLNPGEGASNATSPWVRKAEKGELPVLDTSGRGREPVRD